MERLTQEDKAEWWKWHLFTVYEKKIRKSVFIVFVPYKIGSMQRQLVSSMCGPSYKIIFEKEQKCCEIYFKDREEETVKAYHLKK